MRTGLLRSFALFLGVATVLSAQAAEPEFELASVRHNPNDATESRTRLTLGRYSAINVRLHSLIATAYGIPGPLERFSVIVDGRPLGMLRADDRCVRSCSGADQILKAPFDINATIPQGVPATQEALRPMLRALLQERFNLKARRETRQMPVYALRLVRPGILGPKLRSSSHDCQAWNATRVAARNAVQTGAPQVALPPEPRSAEGRPLCTEPTFNLGQPDGLGIRSAGQLADLVSRIQEMDRPIVDRSGLTGNFEWELIKAIRLDDGRWLPPDAAPLDIALRDQLGLRLDVETGSFEVLIIESVQMPTEN